VCFSHFMGSFVTYLYLLCYFNERFVALLGHSSVQKKKVIHLRRVQSPPALHLQENNKALGGERGLLIFNRPTVLCVC
jgi:hypothetical protein